MLSVNHTSGVPGVNLRVPFHDPPPPRLRRGGREWRHHARAHIGSIPPLTNAGYPAKADAFPANRHLVLWNRFLRLSAVGRNLLFAAALGLVPCCGLIVSDALGRQNGSGVFQSIGDALLACGCVGMIVVALLDARSRYQDYKRVKDLFYEKGPKPRIAKIYMHSKCQRDAARLAAKDLGLLEQLDYFYQSQGYRWYHIFPDFIIKKPWIVLSRRYWQKTLFEPQYTSTHFLW